MGGCAPRRPGMRGVSRLIGAGAGAEAASVAVDRVSRGAGEGLAGLAGRLVTVGRRSQGIADGVDGHAVRIEADRARLHLPAAARCAAHQG